MTPDVLGIVGAMQVEIDAILAAMTVTGAVNKADCRFIIGRLGNTPVAVARCGAGKLNAAICTQALIDLFTPCAVINIGVAGGLDNNLEVGDVVVATDCVQYDFDTRALGDELGVFNSPSRVTYKAVPCHFSFSDDIADVARQLGQYVHRGRIATGDTFIADGEQRSHLIREFGAAACDMEGAAVAYTCLLNLVPCAVLRSISDNANGNASVSFNEFAESAALVAQQIIKAACEGDCL